MGTYFTMLVDTDVTLDAAPATCAALVDALRSRDIIRGGVDGNCVLSGIRYTPGSKVPEIYDADASGYKFWEMCPCDVEPQIKRHFNYYAYGPSCSGVTCPQCSTYFDESLGAFGDTFADAIGEWMEQSGSALLACPRCQRKTPLPDWPAENPLGFGNLSFTFWSWPPFDQPHWSLDIPALFKEISRHHIVTTYGKV